ncbi:hypothetical protein ThesuDRAFT_01126 [Thermaerobacter subterraneus DSM 13965]|uniref:Uncharacterized protein n=1 Tax=Thermaerobacter subterraneus DSM 13965 TaxID=867903 RepID=K6P2S8_9FIRM|nr:hypothetical protein ThesuDRAFT_01126 [Thermaerobacter subterraneus DSM 13965]
MKAATWQGSRRRRQASQRGSLCPLNARRPRRQRAQHPERSGTRHAFRAGDLHAEGGDDRCQIAAGRSAVDERGGSA